MHIRRTCIVYRRRERSQGKMYCTQMSVQLKPKSISFEWNSVSVKCIRDVQQIHSLIEDVFCTFAEMVDYIVGDTEREITIKCAMLHP